MADDELAAIAKVLAAGDEQAAFAQLRAKLGWPRGREIAAQDLARWLALLGDLARRRGAVPLAEVVGAVVRDPDSPDQLYELGYAMIDAGAPAIAATVLWRCLALVGESEEVVCELVSALESALAYPDAFEILEQHAQLRSRSFLCQYLYAFNAAMAGKLAITRATLPLLVPDSPETTVMHGTIAHIIERADRVTGVAPLDPLDLRGWHHVLTGGLLLHQSPYGFDDPMHGRYAWLADSHPRIATGLDRLARLVAPMALPCIYTPAGRNNEILARAAATRLGLPLAAWPTIGVPAPGLVVIYDLGELAATNVQQLVHRRPDQILYAHASPWTVDRPVAADVTMLLHQSLVPPWGDATVIDPGTREVASSQADRRSSEVIAAEIAASPGLPADELVADQADRFAALVERVWPPEPGPRSRQWAGGPVSSSRFA